MANLLNQSINQTLEEELIKNYKDKVSLEELYSMVNVYKDKLQIPMQSEIEESGDIISSTDTENTINNLIFDLKVAYKYFNNTESKILSSLKEKQNEFIKILNNIEKQNKLIDTYDSYIRVNTDPVLITEDFSSLNNAEKDLTLYKERYGTQASKLTTKSMYVDNNVLMLPKTRCVNLAYNNKVKSATVKITNQFCKHSVDNETRLLDPNNILIPNGEVSWSQNLYVDEPIAIQEINPKYEISFGALCEIEINFEAVVMLNELIIYPNSKYPVDLLSIEYTKTDSINEKRKILYAQKNIETDNEYNFLRKNVSYRFKNTLIKKVYITINQLHYERVNMVENIEDIIADKIKFNLSNPNTIEDKKFTFKPYFNDIVGTDKKANVFALNSNNSNLKQIESYILKHDNKPISRIKYNYNYGLETVILNNNEFDNTGIFVSNLIQIFNGSNKISIFTEEEHNKNLNDEYVTDIEYYLTMSDKPRWHDWIPILPVNKSYIYNELLQDYDGQCTLRFNATSVNSVKMDGLELTEDVDYFVKHNDNGYIEAIEIPDMDYISLYTVSYQPVPDAKYIEINKLKDILSYEEFVAENKSTFVLKSKVYTNNIKNMQVKIVNRVTGQILATENNGVYNVTSIDKPLESYKNFTTTSDFQYYINGRNLYFNRSIESYCKVIVSYTHEVNSVRFKAILRRNTKQDKYLTPVVKKLQYRFSNA